MANRSHTKSINSHSRDIILTNVTWDAHCSPYRVYKTRLSQVAVDYHHIVIYIQYISADHDSSKWMNTKGGPQMHDQWSLICLEHWAPAHTSWNSFPLSFIHVMLTTSGQNTKLHLYSVLNGALEAISNVQVFIETMFIMTMMCMQHTLVARHMTAQYDLLTSKMLFYSLFSALPLLASKS